MFYTTRHSALFPAGKLGMTLGCRESDSAAVVVTVKDGSTADRGGVQVREELFFVSIDLFSLRSSLFSARRLEIS